MSKILVACFSAGGVTAKLAKRLAAMAGADLYEIRPEVPYSKEDLNWEDPNSRSSIEMNDRSIRPGIADMMDAPDISAYDTVYIGFPIWWYVAPTIINTFLEQYDWAGKTIIPFATSGSSGMGKTNEGLAPSCPGAKLKEGKRFAADASDDELQAFLEED